MLKQSASFVLASLRDPTYRKGTPPPRSLRPRWTAFLSILQDCSPAVPQLRTVEILTYNNIFSPQRASDAQDATRARQFPVCFPFAPMR